MPNLLLLLITAAWSTCLISGSTHPGNKNNIPSSSASNTRSFTVQDLTIKQPTPCLDTQPCPLLLMLCPPQCLRGWLRFLLVTCWTRFRYSCCSSCPLLRTVALRISSIVVLSGFKVVFGLAITPLYSSVSLALYMILLCAATQASLSHTANSRSFLRGEVWRLMSAPLSRTVPFVLRPSQTELSTQVCLLPS